jgi:hypothetical protein
MIIYNTETQPNYYETMKNAEYANKMAAEKNIRGLYKTVYSNPTVTGKASHRFGITSRPARSGSGPGLFGRLASFAAAAVAAAAPGVEAPAAARCPAGRAPSASSISAI